MGDIVEHLKEKHPNVTDKSLERMVKAIMSDLNKRITSGHPVGINFKARISAPGGKPWTEETRPGLFIFERSDYNFSRQIRRAERSKEMSDSKFKYT